MAQNKTQLQLTESEILKSLYVDVDSVSLCTLETSAQWMAVMKYLEVLTLALDSIIENKKYDRLDSVKFMTESALNVMTLSQNNILQRLVDQQAGIVVKLRRYLGEEENEETQTVH